MCGITGVYKFQNGSAVRENDITRMRETLAHRGPDSAHTYISPDKRVGFGFRRLAIIDLSPAADQPMANADGTHWIVFNGEIYNFESLRGELEKKYTFRSRSDTEVLLAAYQEWGAECVKKLNGIFAFAIWDEKKKILFAARDHLGVKPFYYAVQNGTFYFGSEMKAILAHPDFKKELNEEGVAYYLAFGFAPSPHTLFQDIQKLPPAHCLTVQRGTVRQWEYWNPLRDRTVSKGAGPLTENDYVEEVKKLLGDSIELQMVSDVPFGCFLSGGFDSSLNAALMSKALGHPIETFSVGTKDGTRYNEFEYSRRMAKELGAKNHERLVDFNDFLDFLSRYGAYADDPNADPTCFLVYYLSKLVRDSGVTVIQTGEGGDELFAGYDTYRKATILHPLWKTLEWLPQSLRLAAYRLSQTTGNAPRNELLRRLAETQEPFWGHAIAFSSLQKESLLAKPYRKNSAWYQEYNLVAEHYQAIKKHAPEMDYLNQMAYVDLKMRIADFLLTRVDKMAMAHSIEARVPFLDYRIVELALSIPQNIKIKNGKLKHVLKETARGVIPNEIIDRKKQGFGAPVEEWFRDEEKSRVLMDTIYRSKLTKRGFFDHEYIRDLHTGHGSGKNHTFRLMTLLTLSLWYDYWFE